MQNSHTQKIILLGLIFVGLTFFLASYYVAQQKKNTIAKVTIEITEQEKTLSTIAEITDRNGADAVVEEIIKDCDKRSRFDSLLGRLASLNKSELNETESLFDGCAGFFAERKAVMVSRMEREFEVYKNLVELLTIVDNSIAVSKYKLDEWDQLVAFEKKRSELFTEQVILQKDILTALQQGQSVGSDSIKEMMQHAQDINQEATVTNKQIDALRAELQDI